MEVGWDGLGVVGISLVLHINSLISIDLIMHKYKHNLHIYPNIQLTTKYNFKVLQRLCL